MSILKKPYEISVWEDVWDSQANGGQGKFIEKRLTIIGSNKMTSPGRAIEPTLMRNVNGSRSFTFKMYKRYVDPLSGEEVINPFIHLMVAERKIKLKYGQKIEKINGVEQKVDCWYDFLIKGISEPSATGLYTYTLEDANITELSKNGFNLAFDESLSNNLGTLEELAVKTLEGTGWAVETEKFVQKIEEPLVHLVTTKDIQAYKIIDEFSSTNGVIIDTITTTIPNGTHVLAFYSCCKNKPYRFQFLYTANSIYHTNDKQIVIDKNCQYFIDYPNMDLKYVVKNSVFNLVIPSDFGLANNPKFGNENDNVISLLAKGQRFGFTQKSKYSALLDRYMLKYTNSQNQVYWGFDETEVIAPNLITNLVTTPDLSSTNGWVGAYATTQAEYYNKGASYKAVTESVYGKWSGTVFKNTADLWSEGAFDYDNPSAYSPYLKVTFPKLSNTSTISNMLINSGFYDNRNLVKGISDGDKFILRIKIRNATGHYLTSLEGWDVNLKEAEYQPSSGTYRFTSTYGHFSKIGVENGYIIGEYTIDLASPLSEEEFLEKQIKLVLTPNPSAIQSRTYYIEALEFFKRYDDNNGNYIPLDPTQASIQAKTITTRKLYTDSNLFGAQKPTVASGLSPISTHDLTYTVYKPELYATAEKQRSITIKESNYFNILQTLAETFEAWLEIEITRNEQGAITGKKVKFKNYVGENNYASFRYGVNLTDITRQHDSKTIVTKMVVKDNLNEHAPNGFCTIKRAGSNQTGENILYNFDYYVSVGLLNGVELNRYLYNEAVIIDGIKHGYYTRLGQLNQLIRTKSESLSSLVATKAKMDSDVKVAEETIKAATKGYEQAAEDFYDLAGKAHTEALDEELRKRTDLLNYYHKLSTFLKSKQEAEKTLTSLQPQQSSLNSRISALESEIKTYQDEKDALNYNFYRKYYRFIQEGTWVKEDYVDDEKYYVDAQATLYNSCYPRVTYTINVMEISQLPGYEHFAFGLGDITYAEDKELFGDEGRAEVVITELVQNLDNPSKNTIKVQTYKNYFQDLFQKITATTQQVQYSQGSYHKAERMASADNVLKQEYLKGALNDMSTLLNSAGEQDVKWGTYGLIVQDLKAKSRQIRMVGGAILLSKENSNGEIEWVTGITTDGIVADLLTAGKVNTEQVQIMAGNEPSFRWDQYGITAYDFNIDQTSDGEVVYGINSKKFTRFDRFGFYGAEINNKTINGTKYEDGSAWHPNSAEEIMQHSNFALTWEGLIVKEGTSNAATVRIGKHSLNGKNYLLSAMKGTTQLFTIDNQGNAIFSGNLMAAGGTFTGKLVAAGGTFTGNLIIKNKSNNVLLAAYVSEDTDSDVTSSMVGTATIAGFNFNTNAIYSNGKTLFSSTAEGLYLGKDGIALGDTFSVNKTGYLVANDGKIGAWNITTDGIFQLQGSSVVAGLYKDGVETAALDYIEGINFTRDSTDGKLGYKEYSLPSSKTIFKINKDIGLTTIAEQTVTRTCTLYTGDNVSWTASINLYSIPNIYNILSKTDSGTLKVTMSANGKTINYIFSSDGLNVSSSSQTNIGSLPFKTTSGVTYYGDIYIELDSFLSYPYIDILTKRRSTSQTVSATANITIKLEIYSAEEAILLTNSSILQVERLVASVGKIGLADIADDGSLVYTYKRVRGDNEDVIRTIVSRLGLENISFQTCRSVSEHGFWSHTGPLGVLPTSVSPVHKSGFDTNSFQSFYSDDVPKWDNTGRNYKAEGNFIRIKREAANSGSTRTTGSICSGYGQIIMSSDSWPGGGVSPVGTASYISFEAETDPDGTSDILFEFMRGGNKYTKVRLSEIAALLGK